jgi:DNA-binding NtrC family response regulator
MSSGSSGNNNRALGTVLLVDDEAYVRESLASVLSRRRLKVKTATSVAEALRPGTLAGVDVVVTDLKMPDEDGLSLVRRLAESEPTLPVVVLTGHGTVNSAVECVKAGAFDYLLKPTNPDELAVAVERAIAQSSLRRELDYLRAAGAPPERRGTLGVSEGWREVLRLADVAAPVDTSVLLLGESGVGKEEVAKLLHAKSARAAGPFVRVNCAAIPAELFESEFFGHRRGSFTGAVADREGRFRVAHGGTLFMDEINSLPAVAQAKVLRVLQDGTFERVGDSQPTAVDVRLICASNADLDAEVEAGRFRADLFYRVNVMTITVPPLRERCADIPLLADAFLAEFSARFGKPVRAIHREALAAMEAYSWPGNVRELRNVIERGVLLERAAELSPSSLPFSLLQQRAPEGMPLGEDLNLRASVSAAERRVLEEALRRARGVRREAARLLGIDERNMAYFLRKHGLMERREGRA